MHKVLSFFGVILTVSLGSGCSPTLVDSQSSEPSNSSSVEEICGRPAGVSGSPQTIEDAVRLVNALPKPTSVACFLASLDRPLGITLTNNSFSAQPAFGDRSPRVFIIIDKLIISVVPEGAGRDMIEFSYLTATDRSVKGEIAFPVTETLPLSAAYDQILYATGTRTNCAICHSGEQQVTVGGQLKAFESKAIQPAITTVISVESFRREASICDSTKEPQRCEMLQAIFGYGEVRRQGFPAGMPYAF